MRRLLLTVAAGLLLVGQAWGAPSGSSPASPLRPFGITTPNVCTVGDSITDHDFVVTPSSGSGTPAITALGYGYMNWAQRLSGQKLTFSYLNNFGISGDTTQDILNRMGPILAANCQIVIVHAGTNDLTVLTDTAANIIARLQSIYTQNLALGRLVVATPILPRSGYGSITSQQIINARLTSYQVNRWIDQYARSTPGMILANPLPYFVDQTSTIGDPISGLLYDTTHPDIIGAYWFGKTIADALAYLPGSQPILQTSPADQYDAANNVTGNMLINGVMQNSGVTASAPMTGVIPNSWAGLRTLSAGSTTGTVVASKEGTRSDGLPGDRLVLTFTNVAGGTGTEWWGIRQTVLGSTGKFAQGDVFECMTEIEVSGAVRMNNVRVSFKEFDGTTFQSQSFDGSATSTTAYMPAAWKGILRTQPIALKSPVISTSQVQCLVDVGVDSLTAGGASGVVKIGRTALRKVIAQ